MSDGSIDDQIITAPLANVAPYMATLDRAQEALGAATSVADVSDILTGVDALKRAMGAVEVTEEAKKRADEVFTRSLHALGVALRAEYPGQTAYHIKGHTGLKDSTVRAALALTKADGVAVGTVIDQMVKSAVSANAGSVYATASGLNTPDSKNGPRMVTSSFSHLISANNLANSSHAEFSLALHKGPCDEATHRAQLRGLRSSFATLVEAIDFALRGERSRALSALKGEP